ARDPARRSRQGRGRRRRRHAGHRLRQDVRTRSETRARTGPRRPPMSAYTAPVEEMLFTLEAVAGLDDVRALPGCEDVSSDLARAILEEAGKLGGEVLAPLTDVGDREGARLENGAVRMPTGFI